MERLAVLYDDDCGFCKVMLSGVLLWDRRGELRPVAIQSPEGKRLLAGMDDHRRLASWHAVEHGAPPRSAGAAFPALFRRLPAGAPFAVVAERMPGLTDRAYRAVAARRGAIGPRLPGRLRRRAAAYVASRSR